MSTADRAGGEAALPEQTEVVLAVSRLLVAISVDSMAAVEDEVAPNQLRVLMVLATRGPLSISDVAHALGVHVSNASRACDRLVAGGLIERTSAVDDRRKAVLELSPRGRSIVRTVLNRRRTAIRKVLGRMPENSRATLVEAMSSFAAAGGEPSAQSLWTLGWTER